MENKKLGVFLLTVLTEEEEEDFNQYLKKYQKLINFVAKRYYHISQSMRTLDFMIGKSDLRQEGIIILYNCWKHYRNVPKREFKAIFVKSVTTGIEKKVWGRKNDNVYVDPTYDRNSDDGHNRNSQLNGENDELKNCLYVSPFEEIKEDMEVKELLEQAEEKIKSKIAKAILDELAYPSPRTLFIAIMDEKRKKMMKKQHKGNYVPHDIDIQYQHIYHSLNITKQQFDYAMREIKSVVMSLVNNKEQEI